jgi:predicted nuclease of restriction endonuclease-like RecB superfamily
LVPESQLPYSLRGDTVLPHFLRENDHPWLRALLDEYDRFVGRRQRELDERLVEPLLCAGPPGKRRLAIHVLGRLWKSECRVPLPAKRVRAEVFGEAARTRAERDAILATVAGRLRLTPAELADALFADLPGERRVVPSAEPLSPGELALRANLTLAQALMYRATAVTIEACGNGRTLVSRAKLCGLICTVVARGAAGDALHGTGRPFASPSQLPPARPWYFPTSSCNIGMIARGDGS